MTKTPKTRLLSGSLLLTALLSAALSAGCSTTPDAPAATDQLVFQVCLRDKPMANTKQLDFTIVHTDKRDIEPAMAVGSTVRQQPIFEAVAGDYASIKTTVLSLDRAVWYGFDPHQGAEAARLGVWSDWRPSDYVSRSEDIAYKLQHDLTIDKQAAGLSTDSIKVRYTMMHYKDMLAARASRRLELPHTDFTPC